MKAADSFFQSEDIGDVREEIQAKSHAHPETLFQLYLSAFSLRPNPHGTRPHQGSGHSPDKIKRILRLTSSSYAYSGHRDRLFRSIVITDSGDRDHSSERSDGVVLF
ncbi:MAG: hypothetical protein ACREVK_09650 [Gammaproteobacteria bacterium]